MTSKEQELAKKLETILGWSKPRIFGTSLVNIIDALVEKIEKEK